MDQDPAVNLEEFEQDIANSKAEDGFGVLESDVMITRPTDIDNANIKTEPVDEPQIFHEAEQLSFEKVVIKTEKFNEFKESFDARSISSTTLNNNVVKGTQLAHHLDGGILPAVKKENEVACTWSVDHQTNLDSQPLNCAVVAMKQENQGRSFHNLSESLSLENNTTEPLSQNSSEREESENSDDWDGVEHITSSEEEDINFELLSESSESDYGIDESSTFQPSSQPTQSQMASGRSQSFSDAVMANIKKEPVDEDIGDCEREAVHTTEKLIFEKVVVKSEKSDEHSAAENFSYAFEDCNANEESVLGQHLNADDVDIKKERELHGSIWTVNHQMSLENQPLNCVVVPIKKEEKEEVFHHAVSLLDHENRSPAQDSKENEELDLGSLVNGQELESESFSKNTSRQKSSEVHDGQLRNSKINYRRHKGNRLLDEIHNCETCEKIFDSKKEVERHGQIHLGDKNHACDVCSKTFILIANLRKHKLRSCNKPLNCKICSKAFTSKSNLNAHLLVHFGTKPFKCEICSKVFGKKSNFNMHVQTHSGVIRPYKCELCSKAYVEKSSLNVHVRTHSGVTPHKCELCPKAFIKKKSLNIHVRTHSGARPHKCELCLKAFTKKSSLNIHVRTHSGARPHKCELCLKAFTQKSSLHRHLRIHSGTRPYKCDVCSKAFTIKSHLNVHVRVHSRCKPYKCEICLRTYSTKSYLNVHMRFHSDIRLYKCELCSKAFTTKSNLSKHLRVHSGIRP